VLFQERGFSRWKRLLIDLCLPLAVVGLTYIIVAVSLGYRGPSEFIDWLTLYAHKGKWGDGRLSPHTMIASAMGMAKVFLPRVPGYSWWFAAFGAALCAYAVACVRKGMWASLSAVARQSLPVSVMAWAIPLAVFNFWWCAWNPEFWVLFLLPLITLVALVTTTSVGLLPVGRRQIVAKASLVACLVLQGFALSVYARAEKKQNPVKATAMACAGVLGDGDLMVAASCTDEPVYGLYLADRSAVVISLNGTIASELPKQSPRSAVAGAMLSRLGDMVSEVERNGGKAYVDRDVAAGIVPVGFTTEGLDLRDFRRLLAEHFDVEPVGGDGSDLVYEVRMKK